MFKAKRCLKLSKKMASIVELLQLSKRAKGDMMLSELNGLIGTKSMALAKKLSRIKAPSREAQSLIRLYRTSSTEKFTDREPTPLLMKANFRNLHALQARHSGALDSLIEIMLHEKREIDIDDPLIDHPEEILEAQIHLGVLIQHAAQISDTKSPKEHGIVSLDEALEDMADFARSQAIALANHNMTGNCPAIEFGRLADVKLVCVPPVAEFALVEAVKNAVYSTMMSESSKSSIPPPVIIMATEEDSQVVVQVVDQGVGMDESQCASALKFMRGSARSTKGLVDNNVSYQPMSSPLRGFGVGVCMSRLYLKATGAGSLSLSSAGPGQGATSTLSLWKPAV